MSLHENRKKIDSEYVHFAIKFKNSLALQENSKILAKLGVEFDDVRGLKIFHGFPCHVFKNIKSNEISCCIFIYLVMFNIQSIITHCTVN